MISTGLLPGVTAAQRRSHKRTAANVVQYSAGKIPGMPSSFGDACPAVVGSFGGEDVTGASSFGGPRTLDCSSSAMLSFFAPTFPSLGPVTNRSCRRGEKK
jgi:hypothetical protein